MCPETDSCRCRGSILAQAPRSAPDPYPPEGEPASLGGAAGSGQTLSRTLPHSLFQLKTRRLGEQSKSQRPSPGPRHTQPGPSRHGPAAERSRARRRHSIGGGCEARGRCDPSQRPPAPCPLPPPVSQRFLFPTTWAAGWRAVRRVRRSASATPGATSCGSAWCWPRSAGGR